MAEDKIMGTEDETITDAIINVANLRVSPSPLEEQAESYIEMQADYAKAVELMIQDPSGFSLIDDYVKQLKEQPLTRGRPARMLTYSIKEFVVSGAEFAQTKVV